MTEPNRGIQGQKRVFVGTSGWSYPHWRGVFYPSDLKARDWLAYYAGRFPSVEINSSFYRLPTPETLAHWRDSVSVDFRFAVKASRFITHLKKLRQAEDSLPRFLERVSVLSDRLGPILFQLPPRWHVDLDRLAEFVELLDARRRYVFEFRDASWHRPEVYELLAGHRVAVCIFDLAGRCSDEVLTSDIVYLRLHGPGHAYQGRYGPEALGRWAAKLSIWARSGKTVYCYFDNDQAGHAAYDAEQLLRLLDTD